MPTRPAHRRQIVADIIGKINNGTYPPGSRLPSDKALADQYGCSLTPVKYAMEELNIRGYVVRHQGSATTVAAQPPPVSTD
jgi:DNA-binding GntR family transcriptional regulator